MKKLFILLVFASSFVACKKKTTSPTTTINSTDTTKAFKDTTKNTNSVTCNENQNVDFTCKGTPMGKFGECIKDIDGNVYKTVIIGKQQWMAQNLNTRRFNDGTNITNVIDNKEWYNSSSPNWCFTNNDSVLPNIYNIGKLYSGNVITSTKNVCPSGWHIPSDSEWDILINYLGGDLLAADKLKEISNNVWDNSVNSSNISLFTALPGGSRQSAGDFTSIGNYAYFWCFNKSSNVIGNYTIVSVTASTKKYLYPSASKNINIGLSVRCIKD